MSYNSFKDGSLVQSDAVPVKEGVPLLYSDSMRAIPGSAGRLVAADASRLAAGSPVPSGCCAAGSPLKGM